MAAGSSNSAGENHYPAAPPASVPAMQSTEGLCPTLCESCRSAPAIPFCRVEWSFLCAGCAPAVHSNSWIVGVNPNPSSPYPYPFPVPNPNHNPNTNPSPNTNPRNRQRKRSRKVEVRNENPSANAESMTTKGNGTEPAASAAGDN